MNDVTSFVKTENRTRKKTSNKKLAQSMEYEAPVKRKRGRPPKKPVILESESDSEKYEFNSEDDDAEDYDIFDEDEDYNVNLDIEKSKSGRKKRKFLNDNNEGEVHYSGPNDHLRWGEKHPL